MTEVLWLHQPEHAADSSKREFWTNWEPGERARINFADHRASACPNGYWRTGTGAGARGIGTQRDPNMPAEKINELKKQVIRLAQVVAVANDNIEHLWGGLTSYCKAPPRTMSVDMLLKHMEPERCRPCASPRSRRLALP